MDERTRAAGKTSRILFLNRSYWPDSQATGQLLTQLCEDLSKKFDVSVLAGHPDIVEDGHAWKMDGREMHNGVEIHRVRHLRFAKRSLIGRAFNMCSFTLAAFFSTLFGKRPDVVVSETDPFLLPFIAFWIKVRHGCRFVAYLQDIYPDIAVAVQKVPESLLTRTLRKALWFIYRRADRIIVLSEDMKQRCISNGARDEQFEIIPNWADSTEIVPLTDPSSFRDENGIHDEFVVMYSGNHGLAHELMPIVDAAEQLQTSAPHVLFAFVGSGVRRQALEDAVRDRNLNNVRFFPHQPWRQLSNSLGAADVHLLSVRSAATSCMSPSKLYGILAAGRPAIGLLDPASSHAELIEDEEVGYVCDVTNDRCGTALALLIASLSSEPQQVADVGRRARKLAVRRFDRTMQTRRFGRMLHEVIYQPELDRAADTVEIDALRDTDGEIATVVLPETIRT